MSALRELARVSANVEVSTASREFSFLARALASDSDPATLAAIVERQGTPRLQRILRAGVSAGSTTDAAALSEFRTISSAWLASLQQASVFDELLTGGAKRLPLQTRCIVVSGSVVGSVPNKSMVKPISSMAISAAELAPRKATAIVIATEELFKFSTPSAAQVFDTELRAGVVAATNLVFLSELFSSVVPIASLGNSPSGVMNDIESLLDAITINAASNVYFVIDPDNAKKLATMTHTDGARIFPNFGLKGGELNSRTDGTDQRPVTGRCRDHDRRRWPRHGVRSGYAAAAAARVRATRNESRQSGDGLDLAAEFVGERREGTYRRTIFRFRYRAANCDQRIVRRKLLTVRA